MTEHAYPEIKIIDFGLARQIKDGEQICLIVGTPEYVGKCCICIFITQYTTIFMILKDKIRFFELGIDFCNFQKLAFI